MILNIYIYIYIDEPNTLSFTLYEREDGAGACGGAIFNPDQTIQFERPSNSDGSSCIRFPVCSGTYSAELSYAEFQNCCNCGEINNEWKKLMR